MHYSAPQYRDCVAQAFAILCGSAGELQSDESDGLVLQITNGTAVGRFEAVLPVPQPPRAASNRQAATA